MYYHVKEHDMVCVRGQLLLVRVYMRVLGMINGSHDQCFLEDLLLNRGKERERERERERGLDRSVESRID